MCLTDPYIRLTLMPSKLPAPTLPSHVSIKSLCDSFISPVRVCVCVCACVRACVRAWWRAGGRAGGRACVRACVRVCKYALVTCKMSVRMI